MDHEEPELVAVAENLLAALTKNGQITGEYVTGWSEGIFEAFVSATHRDSLTARHHSDWVRKSIAAVKLQFGDEPTIEILDDDVSLPVPTVKSATSLYLFCDGLSPAGVVRHGNRGTTLPLPLLAIPDILREELFLWKQSWVNHDRIWFDGGDLELAAYQQLADPASSLMAEGRELGQRLEEALKLPVYLYLLRHWRFSKGEFNRRCPSCGNRWKNEESSAPSREPFYRFHFRCSECRLVSHCGVSVDDELATIGSYAAPDSNAPVATQSVSATPTTKEVETKVEPSPEQPNASESKAETDPNL